MTMFGFTSAAKLPAHFDAVGTMTDDERSARYYAQLAGDTRTVAFGFTGQRVPLTQAVTPATDPAEDTK
jgi:hypothetical protein